MNNNLDIQTFASTLGQAVWLMTMTKSHRELPVGDIESLILPALLLRQFKLYSKNNSPVAFLTWASVNEAVFEKLQQGTMKLSLDEWRCGDRVVIVDCISPFNERSVFENKFYSQLKQTL